MTKTYDGGGCLAEATLSVPFDSIIKFKNINLCRTSTTFQLENVTADENLIHENYKIDSFKPLSTAGKF